LEKAVDLSSDRLLMMMIVTLTTAQIQVKVRNALRTFILKAIAEIQGHFESIRPNVR
jgi:hypothetical protein